MNVHIIDHPLVQHNLALIRDKNTPSPVFRQLLRQVSLLFAYEVTRDLPLVEVEVDTPLERTKVRMHKGPEVVLVSIIRAGNGLLDGMLELLPNARVGHIGIYREPRTLVAIEYYFKVPENVDACDMIVVNPLLATGHSAIAAVSRLKQMKPRSLKFVCLVCAPEGAAEFHSEHPDVPIYTAAVDRCLSKEGLVLPGIGDVGDRLYGTR
jgi:uracil phosphoribosyltransferase